MAGGLGLGGGGCWVRMDVNLSDPGPRPEGRGSYGIVRRRASGRIHWVLRGEDRRQGAGSMGWIRAGAGGVGDGWVRMDTNFRDPGPWPEGQGS